VNHLYGAPTARLAFLGVRPKTADGVMMKRFTLSKSMWMAVGLSFAAVAWMLSGLFRNSPPAAASPSSTQVGAEALPTRVSVQVSRARTITREIVVSARTEPNRSVELRAETEGRVVALGAERGARVAAGARIVGLDMRDRQARLAEARALIDYAELQFQAARRLQQQQFVSETHIAELLSRVVAARSGLEKIELEVANTNLVAPFDAVLQERDVEIGDYVNSGDRVAQLVDTDPIIVVGEVGERQIHELAVGTPGFARLVGGAELEGRVRYVAPVAEPSTRTFRVELAVPNAEGSLRAGMTAEMRVAAERVTVHVLSPALLSLDEAGTVGVKAVDARDRVEFHPIEIVESTDAGISVGGLPDEIRLIVVGHGFVKPGELVEPVAAPPRASVTGTRGEALESQQAIAGSSAAGGI
jgi:membrane fusion protein, multidrug efflux system